MSRISTVRPPIDPLDLETIRETLVYIHSDLAHHRGLERAATGIQMALAELDAEHDRRQSLAGGAKIITARFFKWKR